MKEKADERSPTRIALTITELNPGGAERCLTNLALGLNRSRFTPLVVSLGPRPEGGQVLLVQQLERAGIPVFFLGLRSWRQFPAGLRQLQRLFEEQAPEIVQSFLFHANVLGTLAAERAGIPRVFTGVRVADPRRVRLWAERWATRRVEGIVCVSRAVADFVVRQGYFPPQRTIVIPNGIDLSLFERIPRVDRASLGLPEGRRLMTFIGRLDEQKGVDWLLSLAPALLRQTPEHDLVLVGEGPLKLLLQNSAERAGLAGRVHFLGWRSQIPRILAASDLLLLPSRWEGMPNVVLEAMASGLPVVATRSEGVCELLGDAAFGQTTVFGDEQDFIDKARRIVQDCRWAAQLGQANRDGARHTYSLSSMIAAYEDLYKTRGI